MIQMSHILTENALFYLKRDGGIYKLPLIQDILPTIIKRTRSFVYKFAIDDK
jgi:hypothetical protein